MNQLTVTAKTGPAQQVTNQVLSPVSGINFNIEGKLVTVYQGGEMSSPVREYELTGVTSVTFTIAGDNYTMIIS